MTASGLENLVFYAKPRLSLWMLDVLKPTKDDILLDPSVGHCALVKPFLNPKLFPAPKKLILVDIDYNCYVQAERMFVGTMDAEIDVICDDFLKIRDIRPTAVIMTPPVGMRQDILHIAHGYRLLQPGGRLVSTVTEEAFKGKETWSQEFLAALKARKAWDHVVSENCFDGARFRARMIHIQKPALA